ncbi:MAG: molecular chaperone TorD family protein [Betaproteobacteria bacterium]|nr:molecular chaperone TorD family protein [Betaproteobacteria bacterium]
MQQASLAVPHPIAPEDATRADFYALLARLFADGPDAAMLAALARAARMEGESSSIALAWNRLIDASSAMDPAAAAQEYTDLFIGVGKSEVNLHASYWLSGFMMEKPLANLRGSLAELGIARRDEVAMLEDHLSALCETMRLLIAGHGERGPTGIAVQRVFFERYIAPWVFECCAAISNCPIANYYVHVAEFAREFIAVDRDALAMD